MEDEYSMVVEGHRAEYGVEPSVVASAPGRFHLMGEHSWFFRDKTLSMAINLPVLVAVSPRSDTNFHFYFMQLGARRKCASAGMRFRKEDRWANAVKSVLFGMIAGGFDVPGLNFTIFSETRTSAGFGITTAIKAASALAVDALCAFSCAEKEVLQILERANRLYFKADNHLADNASALFSKEGMLMVTNHADGSTENIPFEFSGKTIMLVDAGVPRVEVWNRESIHQPQFALLLGDLKEERRGCYGGWRYEEDVFRVDEFLGTLDEDSHRRLWCVMCEHQHLIDAVDGLLTGNFGLFARSVNRSHKDMGELFDLSCPEIDWILKRVVQLDTSMDDLRDQTSCGRITGKGFGRCLYAFVDNQDVGEFKKKVREYERLFGYKCRCYEVHPSDGAKILRA